MSSTYQDCISKLIFDFPLKIDTDIVVKGKIPTTVSSEFITNREQGDWAERIVLNMINNSSYDCIAVPYGRSENISAGDPGFKEFYLKYQKELNEIGKKPDILVFKKIDYVKGVELTDDIVKKAICAIEVRSSSFLVKKYKKFMETRTTAALNICESAKDEILNNPTLSKLLQTKNYNIYEYLKNSGREIYKDLSFKCPSWHSSDDLKYLSKLLRKIKECITIIQKRDYLSITPKLEDIALVNRWIQIYNIPHYYLQVFFDRGFIISFEDILKISSDSEKEGRDFSIEKDKKNQGKVTIKINIDSSDMIIDNIDMPCHCSEQKELDRGRLLFFVKFIGGKGYPNKNILERILNNGYRAEL